MLRPSSPPPEAWSTSSHRSSSLKNRIKSLEEHDDLDEFLDSIEEAWADDDDDTAQGPAILEVSYDTPAEQNDPQAQPQDQVPTPTNIPSEQSDVANPSASSSYRSKWFKVLSSIRLRGFGGSKVNGECVEDTLPTPQCPDPPDAGSSSSPEIRHSPVRPYTPPTNEDCDDNEREEMGSDEPNRPTSSGPHDNNGPSNPTAGASSPGPSETNRNQARPEETGQHGIPSPKSPADSSAILQPPVHPSTPQSKHDDWDEIDLNSDEETEPQNRQPSEEFADSGIVSDPTSEYGEQEAQVQSDPNPGSIPERDENSSSNTYPPHLTTYFKFLYSIGVSSYGGNEKENGTRHRVLSTLQMIVFIIISMLAFLLSLQYLKSFSLQFAMEQKLDYYISIGQQIFHCISAIYFVKFVVLDSRKITNMLDVLRDGIMNDDENLNWCWNLPTRRLAHSLGITSVIMALLASIFLGNTVKNVTSGYLLLQRSFDITYAVFVWDASNSNQMDELFVEYGKDLSPVTITLGLIGSLIEFCGSLQHYAIRDIMLLAAITLYQMVTNFQTDLQDIGSATAMNTNQMNEQMRKFKYLQLVSEKMGNALGILLIILHIKNLFLCTDFLIDLLNRSNYEIELLFSFFGVVKTFATYIIAAKASRINQSFRKWIHEQCDDMEAIQVGGAETNEARILRKLDGLKIEAVGLGSGMAFVSISFIVKFLGYVASSFIFYATLKD